MRNFVAEASARETHLLRRALGRRSNEEFSFGPQEEAPTPRRAKTPASSKVNGDQPASPYGKPRKPLDEIFKKKPALAKVAVAETPNSVPVVATKPELKKLEAIPTLSFEEAVAILAEVRADLARKPTPSLAQRRTEYAAELSRTNLLSEESSDELDSVPRHDYEGVTMYDNVVPRPSAPKPVNSAEAAKQLAERFNPPPIATRSTELILRTGGKVVDGRPKKQKKVPSKPGSNKAREERRRERSERQPFSLENILARQELADRLNGLHPAAIEAVPWDHAYHFTWGHIKHVSIFPRACRRQQHKLNALKSMIANSLGNGDAFAELTRFVNALVAVSARLESQLAAAK